MQSGPQPSLSSSPDAAREIARRLFAREAGENPSDAALVLACERLPARVADGLTRWFGPYGALALVTRALLRAQASHPALTAVKVQSGPGPVFAGWPASLAEYGAKATAAGAVALLEALAVSIGRLIGDDLTLTLLEQSASALPANAVTTSEDGARSAAGGGAASDNDDHARGKPGDGHPRGTTR